MNKITAIDLFCGAGGLTCGLGRAGINVVLGIDHDKACDYAYATNNNASFSLESIENITGDYLLEAYNGADLTLLAGCAPCQTFSTYNQKASHNDKRWHLLLQFERLIKASKPDFVAMENVPGILHKDVFVVFLDSLLSQGYFVDYQVVNCADYAMAQQRSRLIMIASRLGAINIIAKKAHKPLSVRDAIGSLPAITAGEVCVSDVLHQSASLSDINLERIRQSKPSGTWRDWPSELVADCHKRSTGKTYPGVYGRMSWDEPSPTITTQFYGFGNGRFGHPEQDRAISLREGAILQGFPLDYQFSDTSEPISKRTVGRLIGNAVPVGLGELIGRSVIEHVGINVEEAA